MSLNDQKYRALRTKGYAGSIDDMFMQLVQDTTSRRDAVERDYWLSVLPTATGSMNDVKYQATGSLGYTGSINDRETAYWTNVVL